MLPSPPLEQLGQRVLQQRKAAGLIRGLQQHLREQPRLEVDPYLSCRPSDRPLELVGIERDDGFDVRTHQVREARIQERDDRRSPRGGWRRPARARVDPRRAPPSPPRKRVRSCSSTTSVKTSSSWSMSSTSSRHPAAGPASSLEGHRARRLAGRRAAPTTRRRPGDEQRPLQLDERMGAREPSRRSANAPSPGSRRRAAAGIRPARTTDDLPLPLGPTTPGSGLPRCARPVPV